MTAVEQDRANAATTALYCALEVSEENRGYWSVITIVYIGANISHVLELFPFDLSIISELDHRAITGRKRHL